MDYNTLLIDTLRAKQYITLLEKDILDTWNELQKFSGPSRRFFSFFTYSIILE